ncbi:hypothetical protein D3273_08260 [Lichenibacterium minor]|uniref:Uncharacterized protein n=1 Tax=Lichenibacterium minor TaxID=2316528 RepID=A0A4Q2UBC0_9HYPH|nr:hypothetical protein [Lichenibacterium minor]RYC32376.1 hypothetical protein D3273_08260 [Lichenibacterium minor]
MPPPAPGISLSTRLELNAIADEIAGDGDTFSGALARRLVALLPLTPRPSAVQLGASWSAPGGVAEALTDTGHTASAGGGAEKGGFTLGSDGTFRVGQWKLGHRPGTVEIGRVMEGRAEPRQCRLRYDRGSGAPVDMQWRRWVRLGFGRVSVSVMAGWRFWKRPVP